MMQNLGTRISKFRRFLPLSATIVLFSIVYALGVIFYQGMRDAQVFFTLFITTPFLLISVIGETFVIISGGIDLSVSGVIALTTTAVCRINPGRLEPLAGYASHAAHGDGPGRHHGRPHYLPEGAAVYCHPGGHVVCAWDVLHHQRC